MIYISSDLHVGHANILQFEPRRKEILGSTIEAHDEALLKRFNRKLQPNDTLILLGDLGFGNSNNLFQFYSRLKCRNLILVRGNHDKHADAQYYKIGFSCVCYEMKLKIAGKFVRLSHYPYQKPWWRCMFPWQYKEKDRHKRPVDYGHLLLHGHIHSGGRLIDDGGWRIRGRQFNIGVDANEYLPVSMETVAKFVQAADAAPSLFDKITAMFKI